MDTSDRLYDDFIFLIFLSTHRETSTLENELPEESGQFRFFRAPCLPNLEGSVGLILKNLIINPFDNQTVSLKFPKLIITNQ